jgi:hypothetical protein
LIAPDDALATLGDADEETAIVLRYHHVTDGRGRPGYAAPAKRLQRERQVIHRHKPQSLSYLTSHTEISPESRALPE